MTELTAKRINKLLKRTRISEPVVKDGGNLKASAYNIEYSRGLSEELSAEISPSVSYDLAVLDLALRNITDEGESLIVYHENGNIVCSTDGDGWTDAMNTLLDSEPTPVTLMTLQRQDFNKKGTKVAYALFAINRIERTIPEYKKSIRPIGKLVSIGAATGDVQSLLVSTKEHALTDIPDNAEMYIRVS